MRLLSLHYVFFLLIFASDAPCGTFLFRIDELFFAMFAMGCLVKRGDCGGTHHPIGSRLQFVYLQVLVGQFIYSGFQVVDYLLVIRAFVF